MSAEDRCVNPVELRYSRLEDALQLLEELAYLKPVRSGRQPDNSSCVSDLLVALGRSEWAAHSASDAEWKTAVCYFDRNQLTSMLLHVACEVGVQQRLDQNAADADRERLPAAQANLRGN